MTNPATHKNRARWSIDLSPDHVQVNGLTLVGTINRNGLTDPLLVDGQGTYFAQTPRGVEELRTSKVEATLKALGADLI